ncbi:MULTISPECIES: hypothetical protein [unclassified Exiguobacterium]|uniref:hypothetical protein n=1 Tax=unclassified Exiguobacterium TaxID=2644629 RepID=UPI001BECD6D3|nr:MULTISPECIES: hypothetical protein [unclassified Exiguobacterium]
MNHSKPKEKILLAIGVRTLEEYFKNELGNEFHFVGTSTYREGVLKNIEQNAPDIVILREQLKGTERISEIIYNIRTHHPEVRIIFVTGSRNPGDALLASLVNLQIFDILAEEKVPAKKIIDLVRHPNQYHHVSHLQPKPVIDESSNEILFQPPQTREVVRHVEKTVFVEQKVEQKEMEQSPNPPEVREKKSRGFFGSKKEEPVHVDTPDSIPDVEPQESGSKGFFGRKSKAQPVLNEDYENAERLKLKTLELQREVDLHKNNQEAEAFVKRELSKNGKQKILTFIGSEHGVGNTQIALNTSIQLALSGYKTIYIELKERPSTVDYLYQLHRNMSNGLEAALFGLETGDYSGVHKSIVRMKEVIERTNGGDVMLNAYKLFPNNLDFLFFSPSYTESSNEISAGNPQTLKELCMHLLFEAGYHYIILDADMEKSNPYTETALRFGTQVFYTLTQDICHVGNSVRQVTEYSKSINLVDKLYYVVNKYEDSELDKRAISDWLKHEVHMVVPNTHKDFVNANYHGIPAVLGSRNKELKKAFVEIAKTIENM